eukprot:6951082-Prymnesium_polylepis.1
MASAFVRTCLPSEASQAGAFFPFRAGFAVAGYLHLPQPAAQDNAPPRTRNHRPLTRSFKGVPFTQSTHSASRGILVPLGRASPQAFNWRRNASDTNAGLVDK